MDTQLFQARGVRTDVVNDFHAEAQRAGTKRYGQYFEYVWEFFVTHGGPEWVKAQISRSVDRSPPLKRRMGSDYEERIGGVRNKGGARGPKNSRPNPRKRATIDPAQHPMEAANEQEN